MADRERFLIRPSTQATGLPALRWPSAPASAAAAAPPAFVDFALPPPAVFVSVDPLPPASSQAPADDDDDKHAKAEWQRQHRREIEEAREPTRRTCLRLAVPILVGSLAVGMVLTLAIVLLGLGSPLAGSGGGGSADGATIVKSVRTAQNDPALRAIAQRWMSFAASVNVSADGLSPPACRLGTKPFYSAWPPPARPLCQPDEEGLLARAASWKPSPPASSCAVPSSLDRLVCEPFQSDAPTGEPRALIDDFLVDYARAYAERLVLLSEEEEPPGDAATAGLQRLRSLCFSDAASRLSDATSSLGRERDRLLRRDLARASDWGVLSRVLGLMTAMDVPGVFRAGARLAYRSSASYDARLDYAPALHLPADASSDAVWLRDRLPPLFDPEHNSEEKEEDDEEGEVACALDSVDLGPFNATAFAEGLAEGIERVSRQRLASPVPATWSLTGKNTWQIVLAKRMREVPLERWRAYLEAAVRQDADRFADMACLERARLEMAPLFAYRLTKDLERQGVLGQDRPSLRYLMRLVEQLGEAYADAARSSLDLEAQSRAERKLAALALVVPSSLGTEERARDVSLAAVLSSMTYADMAVASRTLRVRRDLALAASPLPKPSSLLEQAWVMQTRGAPDWLEPRATYHPRWNALLVSPLALAPCLYEPPASSAAPFAMVDVYGRLGWRLAREIYSAVDPRAGAHRDEGGRPHRRWIPYPATASDAPDEGAERERAALCSVFAVLCHHTDGGRACRAPSVRLDAAWMRRLLADAALQACRTPESKNPALDRATRDAPLYRLAFDACHEEPTGDRPADEVLDCWGRGHPLSRRKNVTLS